MTATRRIILVLGDIVALGLAFTGMLLIRFGLHPEPGIVALHKTSIITLSIIWLIILYVYNLYDAQFIKTTLKSFRNITLAILTSLGVGFILFYLVPFPVAPKTNLVISVGLFAFFLTLWRSLYSHIVAHNFKKRVAIVGNTPETHRLIEVLQNQSHLGYIVFGPYVSVKDSLVSCPDSEMIIYDGTLTGDDLRQVVQSDTNIINVREAYKEIFHLVPVNLVDDAFAVTMIEKNDTPLYRTSARIFSIIIALVILIVTLPFTLIAAIAIYLQDRGQIFIRQERVGERGNIFKLYKFRSMIMLGKDGQAETGKAIWAGENDPRITPVGKIIRKLHIDEIPQMVNILKGDITLVGPRPERPEFVTKLAEEIPYYFVRHSIRPGFTGWAQIKFRYARSVMDSQEKFEYDLYYIKNRNFLLDIGILAKTVQIIFTH